MSLLISRWSSLLFTVLLAIGAAAPARAQEPAAAAGPANGQSLLDFLNAMQDRLECEGTHCTLIGRAQLDLPNNARFSADHIELIGETGLIVGTGNVVFASGEGRLAAEKVEYNWTDGTGIFHEATGLMTLGAGFDRTQFGGQEPDIYFGGERIEKVASRRYRITRGWFTACVQPTPRWEISSGTMELNLDDYAIAKHTVLRVKGVPMMYLPVIYYPIQEDDRATGFLLPTYGTSTLRGQTVSNAFFWAMGRSHDATFFHDWFTKAGQGFGAEYRFVTGQRSFGNVRLFRFSQNESEYVVDGRTRTLPRNTTYEVRTNVTHALRQTVRLGGRVDFASDVVSQQLYHQNVYSASNPVRTVEGNMSGTWGAWSASAQYQRNELFRDATSSQVYGGTPRVTGSMAPQRLFDGPVYASVNGEASYLPFEQRQNGRVTDDRSLAKFDLAPTLRVPLSTLTYLTVNSTAAYRTTYYSRSQGPRGLLPEPLARTYLSLRSDITGPVLSKIWDTPESLATDRMKHVIEPTFSVDYVTDIDDFAQVPIQNDTTDVIVGGSSRVTYGVTNRLFRRSRPEGTTRGTSNEFLTLGVQQTYYTDREASRWDTQYYTASNRANTVDLSPIAITARLTPTQRLEAQGRIEYDVSGLGLIVLSGSGGVSVQRWTGSLNYSRIRNRRDSLSSHTLAGQNTVRFLEGRVTGSHSVNLDLVNVYVISQTLNVSYLAQCCGIQVEYQTYNYPQSLGFPIPADRRFNLGFVLAGLGNVPFSNFFGAFGGQTQ